MDFEHVKVLHTDNRSSWPNKLSSMLHWYAGFRCTQPQTNSFLDFALNDMFGCCRNRPLKQPLRQLWTWVMSIVSFRWKTKTKIFVTHAYTSTRVVSICCSVVTCCSTTAFPQCSLLDLSLTFNVQISLIHAMNAETCPQMVWRPCITAIILKKKKKKRKTPNT